MVFDYIQEFYNNYYNEARYKKITDHICAMEENGIPGFQKKIFKTPLNINTKYCNIFKDIYSDFFFPVSFSDSERCNNRVNLNKSYPLHFPDNFT